MNIHLKIMSTVVIMGLSSIVTAQDITGIWQSIDDQNSKPKALIEIKKDANGQFSGRIVKTTPSLGYKAQEFCVKCPGNLKDKPLVGLNIIQQLKHVKGNEYDGGQILDPLSGKTYKLSMKLSNNGNTLRVHGYQGIQAIGRTQTWVRQK